MKCLRVAGAVVLVGAIGGGFLYLCREVYAEREVLKQVVKRQKEQFEEMERRIQELEEKLEALQKEPVLTEKKVTRLKKKRQQVKPLQNENELV